MDDPKDTRMIQTRDGVARIPRSQQGVALRDYFQNTELPKDLERAQVFASPAGPVAVNPDPVPWAEEHDSKVQEYAETLYGQIALKGYYARSLDQFANRLSDDTGYPVDEMKAMIISKFDATYGQDPFDHLQAVRAEKGLPVRERGAEPSHRQEPEM